MSERLTIANALASRTLAELTTFLPGIIATYGADTAPAGMAPASFTLYGTTATHPHSVEAAAQAWGQIVLNGEPAACVTGPAGQAGVMGEVIDPFLRNCGTRTRSQWQ